MVVTGEREERQLYKTRSPACHWYRTASVTTVTRSSLNSPDPRHASCAELRALFPGLLSWSHPWGQQFPIRFLGPWGHRTCPGDAGAEFLFVCGSTVPNKGKTLCKKKDSAAERENWKVVLWRKTAQIRLLLYVDSRLLCDVPSLPSLPRTCTHWLRIVRDRVQAPT